MENHGQEVLSRIDADIAAGRIEIYTGKLLKEQAVYTMFRNNVTENKLLYQAGDLGEISFSDILILRYLTGEVDARQTVDDFNSINEKSVLNWSFKSQIKKFIKRFVSDPYKSEEKEWMDELVDRYRIKLKSKFLELTRYI